MTGLLVPVSEDVADIFVPPPRGGTTAGYLADGCCVSEGPADRIGGVTADRGNEDDDGLCEKPYTTFSITASKARMMEQRMSRRMIEI